MNRELRQIGMVAGVLLFVGLWGAGSAHAAVIGSDTFDYTDGNVAGRVLDGGVGWAWVNSTQTQTGGKSAWYRGSTRNPYINTGGMYTNNDSYAMRTYSNPNTDGTIPDTIGRLYFGVNFTRTVSVAETWGGFGPFSTTGRTSQFMFFGAPWTGGTFGIADALGNPVATSAIPVVTNQEYRIVAVVDYDGDQVRMWINPDQSDYDIAAANNTADLVGTYTGTDSSTAVGVNSGAITRWDNLVVATDFSSAVPEPASLALLGLGGLVCIRRRR